MIGSVSFRKLLYSFHGCLHLEMDSRLNLGNYSFRDYLFRNNYFRFVTVQQQPTERQPDQNFSGLNLFLRRQNSRQRNFLQLSNVQWPKINLELNVAFFGLVTFERIEFTKGNA